MTDPRISRAAESDRAVYHSTGTVNSPDTINNTGTAAPEGTYPSISGGGARGDIRGVPRLQRDEQEKRLRRTVPVASFQSYADAEAAVHELADAAFPVERTTIVGCDLRLMEQVTGRLTATRAAGLGAASGAWVGFLVGLLLAVFVSVTIGGFFGVLLLAIVLGAIFGAIFGLVSYLVADRFRGFTSDRLILAGRYDLHADPEVADPLRTQLLQRRPAAVQAAGQAGAAVHPQR
jgi:heat induced stress protein YflT